MKLMLWPYGLHPECRQKPEKEQTVLLEEIKPDFAAT